MRLVEASPLTGGMIFHMVAGARGASAARGADRGAADRRREDRRSPSLLLLVAGPAWAPRRSPATGFDVPSLPAAVFTAALAVHRARARWRRSRIQQLTVWGLRGLTTLDPR